MPNLLNNMNLLPEAGSPRMPDPLIGPRAVAISCSLEKGKKQGRNPLGEGRGRDGRHDICLFGKKSQHHCGPFCHGSSQGNEAVQGPRMRIYHEAISLQKGRVLKEEG